MRRVQFCLQILSIDGAQICCGKKEKSVTVDNIETNLIPSMRYGIDVTPLIQDRIDVTSPTRYRIYITFVISIYRCLAVLPAQLSKTFVSTVASLI